MDREQFLQGVKVLREEGKTIRAIAAELGVHRSRVERALKTLFNRMPDQSPRVGGATGNMIVGRQREMGELVVSLDDSLRGQGRLVMLVGQPGIGKTRIAQELAAIAEQRGTQVLWGRCHEQQGAPPYWPWIQIIRAYVQRIDADSLLTQMGGAAADIAEIAPEVRDKIPDLEPLPTLEPQQARFRLFDSITTFLKKVSQSQPLVLILEDLHWADRSSLFLLEFLVQELAESRLLVIGTYREVELSSQSPLSHTVGEMVRNPLFQLVRLAGLMPEDVGQYLGHILGSTPSQDLVEAIYTRTEGNPFFMTEVVRLWQHISTDPEQAKGDNEWTSTIPDKVSAAIGRRLSHLPESCNRALTIASVIGSEFGLDQLERVMGGPSGERLLEVLGEPLAARIIEEVPNVVGRYRFTHVLIRETLSQELSSARRAQLHAGVGQALEELYGADAEDHAAELAYHFAEAQAVLGPQKLVRYSLVAGERALAAHAWQEALAYLQGGLEAKEGQPVDQETADILFGLGRTRAATTPRSEAQEVWDIFSRAFDCYLESGNIHRALDVAGYRFPFGPYIKGQAQVTKRALDLAPPDSHQKGSLLYQYGLAVYYELGDYDKAQEALNKAIEIALREKDTALEVSILSSASVVDIWERRIEESAQKNLRILELLPNVEMPFAETLAKGTIARHALITGDLHRARQYASESLAAAEGSYHYHHLTAEFFFNATLARLQGDWQGVRHFTDEALNVSKNEALALCARALLYHELGETEKGNALIEQLLDAVPVTAPEARLERQIIAQSISLIAQNTGAAGRIDTAQRAAQVILSTSQIRPTEEVSARASLGMIAAYRQDADLAHEQYEVLKSSTFKVTTQCLITLDRTLGLLAHTMGQLDAATRHFDDALTFCRKAGYRPELALSCHDYANSLVERNGPGDREKALSLINESLAVSTELGMRPLMERVVALQERARSLPATVPELPGGLTEREVEVLRLVASGKSNAEIAGELVLSIRTVERHISNIYGKIGSGGRADATAFAFTSGLMSLHIATE